MVFPEEAGMAEILTVVKTMNRASCNFWRILYGLFLNKETSEAAVRAGWTMLESCLNHMLFLWKRPFLGSMSMELIVFRKPMGPWPVCRQRNR